jgi:fructokinase
MVSRVGADRLGEEVLRRAPWYGVGADLIQVDAELPTGFVRVNIDETGNAEYEILEPAAWDAITLDDSLVRRAEAASAIVFGTVAQRRATTRATLEQLWQSDALMVFDANLRPPYEDRDVVRRSLRSADIVKVTERELARIADWFGLRGDVKARATALAEEFDCGTVCVTRGREGAALWRDGRWTEEPGYEVDVRDTVGAGDAFLALVLAGLLDGADDRVILRHANLIGAYVATQSGAVPLDQPAAISPPLPANPSPRPRRP